MQNKLELGIYQQKLTNFKWKILKKKSTVFRISHIIREMLCIEPFQETFDL